MKVVVDTNILVSGLITAGGPCSQIIDLAVEGVLELFVDDRILGEYDSILHRPSLGIEAAEADEILSFIGTTAEPVAAVPLPETPPNPDDTAFLEVARTAGAFLVTGNKRHFPRSMRCGVTVVGPRELLDILGRTRSDA